MFAAAGQPVVFIVSLKASAENIVKGILDGSDIHRAQQYIPNTAVTQFLIAVSRDFFAGMIKPYNSTLRIQNNHQGIHSVNHSCGEITFLLQDHLGALTFCYLTVDRAK